MPPLPHPLPSWAQASFQDRQINSVSLEHEELYLRSKAYQTIAQHVDDVLEATIDKRIHDWVPRFNTDLCQTDQHESKDQAINCIPTIPFVTEPSNQYHEMLLPVFVLPSPHHPLDQTYLSHALMNKLLKANPHQAVCHLSPLHGNKPFGLTFLIEEILQQCWALEKKTKTHFDHMKQGRHNNQNPFKNQSQSSNNTISSSLSSSSSSSSKVEQLLAWARQTRTFRQLLIILVPEPTLGSSSQSYGSMLYHDFLSLLQELRSTHHLDVSLLCLIHDGSSVPAWLPAIWIPATSRQQQQQLQPDNRNKQVCHQPNFSSFDILQTVLETIGSTLTLVSPKLTSHIFAWFQTSHGSFVQAVAQLKQSLALQLSLSESSSSYLTSLLLVSKSFALPLQAKTSFNFLRNETFESSSSLHPHRRRLEWFLCTQQERLRAISHSHKCHDKTSSWQELCDHVHHWERVYHSGLRACFILCGGTTFFSESSSSLFVDLIHSLQEPCEKLYSVAQRMLFEIKKRSWMDLWKLLLAVRTALIQVKQPQEGSSSQLDVAIAMTNEIIVLMAERERVTSNHDDNLNNDDNSGHTSKAIRLEGLQDAKQSLQFQDDFWQCMCNWIHHLLQMTCQAIHEYLDPCLHQSSRVVTDLIPHPRRNVAMALLDGITKTTTAQSQPFGDTASNSSESRILSCASTLFELMEDCVTISRWDWFERFQKSFDHPNSCHDDVDHETDDLDDTWALFSLGVYQLLYLGLIREKVRAMGTRTSSESIPYYEKTAFVWTSGDG